MPLVKPRRTGAQRGSTVLEAGLTMLPLIALLLAVIDFSVAVFIRNTLMNAAREGVRFGVTGRTVSGSQDNDIKNVVRRYSMGFLNGPQPANRIEILYYDPETMQPVARNDGGNILEVRINNFPWLWMAPVLRNNQSLSFNAVSADVVEPIPNPPPR